MDNAPAPRAVPLPAPAQPFGDFSLMLWHSFPPEETAKVIGLVQGKVNALGDLVNGEPIAVRHVIAHRVESVDEETGEVTSRDRIVLVSPDGTAYATMSEGVRRSLLLLMTWRGMPPFTPPLRVKVEQSNTGKGRRTYFLTPVD